jgi:hypothetical protein
VYPGGESGNPFSTRYDAQIPAYLAFERDPLLMPSAPDDVPAGEKISDQRLSPSSEARRPR